ncbi:MAG: CxxC-x17-CxxC domain-containing protein [Patescibacteria group bacterium]
MGNFDSGRKFGSGNKFGGGGGRSFGGGGGGRSRGFGGPSIRHKAICSECGNECELPFRPTGDRPVFCSNCFGKQQDQNQGDSRPSSYGFNTEKRYDKPRHADRQERQRFDAVCAKCGATFQLPFRPIPGKTVFCDNCFDRPTTKGSCDCGEQIKMLNEKLDKILKILAPKISVDKAFAKEAKEVKAVKEVKEEIAEPEVIIEKTKKSAKEKAPKKAVTKKKKD